MYCRPHTKNNFVTVILLDLAYLVSPRNVLIFMLACCKGFINLVIDVIHLSIISGKASNNSIAKFKREKNKDNKGSVLGS